MSEDNFSNSAFSNYAFISIGANLPSAAGTPLETIALAFKSIAELSSSEFLKSSIFSSSPVDSPEGTPDFFNALIAIIPQENETPLSLLHKLQGIENKAGRTRSGIKNEARILDLDLILFRQEICQSPELILPHPRAHERRFVLEPLLQIVEEREQNFIFPGTNETVESLLQKTDTQQQLKELKV